MYSPFVFGLNYETADFEIREKLAFSREVIPSVINRLQGSGITREVVILSTCNRTEIYCVTHDIDFVINAICDIQNVCPRTVKKYSYVHSGVECAKHIFRVVSGLESMVLGETEIVAQTKDAFLVAQTHNAVTTQLSVLFNMALAVEKDVRNFTEINNIGVSFGHALTNLVAVRSENLASEKLLFIGAGEMMTQIAPHFKNINLAQKTVVNRTFAKAEALASRVAANALRLNDLMQKIAEYTIIIACCNSDKPLLDVGVLEDIIEAEQKLLIIDLSMPLISSLDLRKYSNITLITIDDIAKIVDVGVQKRKVAAVKADQIINDKLIEYQNWLKKRSLTPLIKALRDSADSTRLEVLSAAQNQLNHGEDAMDVLRNFSVKLMNKLLHTPTVNLCAVNDDEQDNLAKFVSYLYELEIKE